MIVKKIKNNMAKLTTQTTLVLAHAICSVWKWGRKLGNKNNFDYFIRNLSTQYPTTNKMAEASLASSPFICSGNWPGINTSHISESISLMVFSSPPRQ